MTTRAETISRLQATMRERVLNRRELVRFERALGNEKAKELKRKGELPRAKHYCPGRLVVRSPAVEMSSRPTRCEIAPGVFAHRTTDPKRGICDDCGVDMRLEPTKPCQPTNLISGMKPEIEL